MKVKTIILRTVLLCLFLQTSSAATDKVLCYYEAWSSTFSPDDIDVNICTHIAYAFFGLNGNGTVRNDYPDSTVFAVTGLKQKNPNLKVVVSVGGWGEGSEGFSSVANDPVLKTNMARSIQGFIDYYGFDGVDVDWEYPTQRGGTPSDRAGFVDMLHTIRDVIGPDHLITTAVWFLADEGCYDVVGISNVVDYINIMTYDIHSVDEGKTGQNSPLYAASTDTDYEKQVSNSNASVHNWINAGADPSKITLGLGFYGKRFNLVDSNDHVVNSPSTGGEALIYPDICQLTDGWTDVYDEEQRNPYKYKGDQWIGFDDPRSIGEKVQYAKSMNLAGVMMWAVDEDDKNGLCGERFPLLNAIKNNM